jgi:hypothetical protein
MGSTILGNGLQDCFKIASQSSPLLFSRYPFVGPRLPSRLSRLILKLPTLVPLSLHRTKTDYKPLQTCNASLDLFPQIESKIREALQVCAVLGAIQISPTNLYIPDTAMASEAALTTTAARAIAPHLFPDRTPITKPQIEKGIECCLGIQRRAVTFGKRPFAACLLGPDNETVLLMHQSIDQVNHAESSLARLAYSHYSKEYLWRCTLVSTWEPCAMCSGSYFSCHHFGL